MLKYVFAFFILLFGLAYSCGGDPSKTNKTASETNPTSNDAGAPANPGNSAAAPASNAGKPKHLSIDTNSNASRAEYDKRTPGNNTPLPIVHPEKMQEKPAGPPGFVTRDGTVLYAEPSTKSAQIATMKKTENVYILQTSMMDENGKEQPYPTWFKVQRKNKEKQTGWVIGKMLDSGGGG
ncbi:MAG TPA: hypothetical protein PLO67_21935 [Saprospiraceae bacterium]|nr:hypothetical protein [Saprospiraceae bacterium]HPI09147.1 hypothetical protein [Saprospiraceae bacterium]